MQQPSSPSPIKSSRTKPKSEVSIQGQRRPLRTKRRHEDGSRKRVYGPVCATKADAEIELDKLLAARAERKLLKRSSATVAQYVGNHLDNDAHVGARTLERYRSILRCQIAPHIGGVKLQDLKASHLTKLYADLETTRSDNKKKVGLSKATIRQVHALMHVVLAFAEQDDILATNVAAKVKQKPKAQSPEVRPPADNDLGRLLDALRGSDLYTLVLLAAHTGMRRGELLGLRWAEREPGRTGTDGGSLSLRTRRRHAGLQVPEERRDPPGVTRRACLRCTGSASSRTGQHHRHQQARVSITARPRTDQGWQDGDHTGRVAMAAVRRVGPL